MSATPVSSAQICIVRRAISWALGDGIVYASSYVGKALVWHPDSAAARL